MYIVAALIFGAMVFIAILVSLDKILRIEVRHVYDYNREQVKYVPVELDEEESRQLKIDEADADQMAKAMEAVNKIMHDLEE
jgi:hypothetical protein